MLIRNMNCVKKAKPTFKTLYDNTEKSNRFNCHGSLNKT